MAIKRKEQLIYVGNMDDSHKCYVEHNNRPNQEKRTHMIPNINDSEFRRELELYNSERSQNNSYFSVGMSGWILIRSIVKEQSF